MINRLHSDYVEKLMKQFPVVALLGPRQCGKTTLAKQFKKGNKKTTVYFDLEIVVYLPKSIILYAQRFFKYIIYSSQ